MPDESNSEPALTYAGSLANGRVPEPTTNSKLELADLSASTTVRRILAGPSERIQVINDEKNFT